MFAVRPERQRQGVGTSLLAWLEASAVVAGSERIRVEARSPRVASTTSTVTTNCASNGACTVELPTVCTSRSGCARAVTPNPSLEATLHGLALGLLAAQAPIRGGRLSSNVRPHKRCSGSHP
ncbi:GNAT family N-acetyltransferase [Piscinibacter defluvii]|uniref:GNAT family N-acetyltransferase n=1 Tax=Piscinibacter defluvii TaxID=1796922 RepID=UPI0035C0F4D8